MSSCACRLAGGAAAITAAAAVAMACARSSAAGSDGGEGLASTAVDAENGLGEALGELGCVDGIDRSEESTEGEGASEGAGGDASCGEATCGDVT